MKSLLFGTGLLLALILGASAQAGSSYFSEVHGDTAVVYLDPGDTADGLTAGDIQWPDAFGHYIQLVNDGQGEFFVEVSTDTTQWDWVNRVLSQRYDDSREVLHRTQDGGLSAVRYQNGLRLLREKGLEKKATRYISEHRDHVYIKMYYSGYPASNLSLAAINQKIARVNRLLADSLMTQVDQKIDRVKEDILEQVDQKLANLSKYQPKSGSLWRDLGLGLHFGAGTTENSFGALAKASVLYRHQFMLSGYGLHSFVANGDQEVQQDEFHDTFDWGGGALVGYKLADPLWLSGGWHWEQSVFNGGSYSGKAFQWQSVGQLGLMVCQNHWSIEALATYGHHKQWDGQLDTNWGLRFGVALGNTWGW